MARKPGLLCTPWSWWGAAKAPLQLGALLGFLLITLGASYKLALATTLPPRKAKTVPVPDRPQGWGQSGPVPTLLQNSPTGGILFLSLSVSLSELNPMASSLKSHPRTFVLYFL
jgi:hypothetical protein